MRQTLRWKKTTGIIAVILGGLSLTMCVVAINNIVEFQKILDTGGKSGEYLAHLDATVHEGYIFVPIVAAFALAIFALGIALLAVDSGIPADAPRPKARMINIALICSAFAFEVTFIAYYINASINYPGDMVTHTLTQMLSISLGLTLIAFSILGLSPALQTSSATACANPTITANSPTNAASPIDAEIAALKKQVEKYKLEKANEAETTKRKEITALKQELKNLIAKTEAPHE